jgi:hypothetical protein
MKLKKFNNFKLNEDLEGPQDTVVDTPTGEVTLYRLTSHSVVDLNDPGEFYVNSQQALDPSLLDKPGTDLFVITVTTDSSNIDTEGSEKEATKHNNESIVMVKDSTKCEIVTIVPYTK